MALELINNLDTAGNAFNKNNEAINNIIVSGALNGNVLTYTTFSGATIEVTLPITESGVVLTTQSGSIDIAGVDPACTVEVPALQYTYNALGKTTFSASFAFVSPDPTLDRVDSVVLNPVTNSVSIVNGTPANPPVSPTITDPNFLLGSIYVFAGQPCENSVFIYSAINTQLATILSQLTIDLINGAGGGDTIPVYDGTLYVNESTIGGNGSFANPFETMEDAINSVAVDTPTLIVCLGDNPNVGVGLIDLSGKDIYIDARGKDIAYDHDVFDVNNSRDFSLHCQNIISLNGSSLVTTETKTATIRVDGTITNNNTGSLADLAVFEGNRFDVKAGIYEGTAPLFSNLAIAPALGSICEIDYINMTGGVFTFTGGGYIKLKLKVNIMATAVVSGAPQFMANLASGSIIEGNYNITGDFVNHGGDFNQFITFKNCNANLTGRLTPNNNNITLDNSVINCVANPTLNVVLIGWTIRNNSRINCNVAGYALVFEPSSTITDSIISNSNATGDCVAMQGGIAIDCIAIKSSNARTGFLNLGAGSTGNQETPSLAVTPTGTELLSIQEDGNTSKTVTLNQIAGLGGDIEDSTTAETDTSLILKPDGLGGVDWSTTELTQSAWANYGDTQYTDVSPLVLSAGVEVPFTNNALDSVTSFMPAGVSFFDSVTQKITPQSIGETYALRFSFKATTTTNNNNLIIRLDIGGTQGVILERTISLRLGAAVLYNITNSNELFALNQFVSNGGTLTIEAQDSNTEIYDINFYIVRNTSTNIDIPDAPVDGNVYGRKDGAWAISGGGGGVTSYSYQFGKGGAITTGNVVSAPVSGTATNQLGIPIQFNSELKDLSITFGLTQAGATSTVPVFVREFTTGESGSGTPLTSTGGALKRTRNCSVAAGTAYSKTFLDTDIAGVTLTAGNVLFIGIGTITGGATITDISIHIRTQRV